MSADILGDHDPRPVDSFVRDIRFVLEGNEDICEDYRGQVKHCCNAIHNCYASMDQTLVSVRLQGALRQNMHKACRRIDEELQSVQDCVDRAVGMCIKIDPTDVKADFLQFKNRLKAEFQKHCDNLPPERTTSETQPPLITTVTTTTESEVFVTLTTDTAETTPTTPVLLTSETPPTTVDEIQHPTHVTESSTAQTNINITDTDDYSTAFGERTVTGVYGLSKEITTNTEPKPLQNQSTDIATTSSSTLTTWYWSGKGTETNLRQPLADNTVIIVSAVGSAVVLLLALLIFFLIWMKKKGYLAESVCACSGVIPCRWFQRDKRDPGPQDEIYAEIDEAFMQAVYEFDKKKDPHPNLKNRVQTNAHVNMCYSNTDDGVITSSKARGPTLQLSTRNLRQIPKQNTYQTTVQMKSSIEKDIPKSFVLSHPTFTDPRGTEVVSDEYVQISDKYESIETVYDHPRNNQNALDNEDIRETNVYEHIVTQEVDREPEYINSGQKNDHLYENEIGTYEITQSRF